MTTLQKDLFKCLEQENLSAKNNDSAYLENTDLLKEYCAAIPDKYIEYFLKNYHRLKEEQTSFEAFCWIIFFYVSAEDVQKGLKNPDDDYIKWNDTPQNKKIFDILSKIFRNLAKPKFPYSMQKQSPEINILQSLTKKSFNTYGMEEGKYTKGDLTVIVDNLQELNLDVPTHQLLDKLLNEFTASIHDENIEDAIYNRHFSISLKNYMEYFDLKDRKNATERLDNSIKDLQMITIIVQITQTQKHKGIRREISEIPLLGKKTTIETIDINKKKYRKLREISFSQEFAEYYANKPVMPYHEGLRLIRPKDHPYSYYIGRKLCQQRNIPADNSNTISVKSLLEACKKVKNPEEVKSRSYTQKIREPFEKSLRALKDEYGILESFYYTKAKGERLSQYEVENATFKDWESWYLHFELDRYKKYKESIKKQESPRLDKKTKKTKSKTSNKAKK